MPVSLHVPYGQTFAVGVYDYGCYRFSYWLDSGSTARFRDFTTTVNMTETAVYANICQSLPQGYSNINVNTVNGASVPITGLYTTIWQNGNLLQSCFSDCSFAVGAGTYQVGVADFGSSLFKHWTDGVMDRFHTVVVGSSSSEINMTAVYGTNDYQSKLAATSGLQATGLPAGSFLWVSGLTSPTTIAIASIAMILSALATVFFSKLMPSARHAKLSKLRGKPSKASPIS